MIVANSSNTPQPKDPRPSTFASSSSSGSVRSKNVPTLGRAGALLPMKTKISSGEETAIENKNKKNVNQKRVDNVTITPKKEKKNERGVRARRVIFPVIHPKPVFVKEVPDSELSSPPPNDILEALSQDENTKNKPLHTTQDYTEESLGQEEKDQMPIATPSKNYRIVSTPRLHEQGIEDSKSRRGQDTLLCSILRHSYSSPLPIIDEDSLATAKRDVKENRKSNNPLNPVESSQPVGLFSSLSSSSIPSLVSESSHSTGDANDATQSELPLRHSHSHNCMAQPCEDCLDKNQKIRRASNHKCVGVKFNPRVWVFEYERTPEETEGQNWFNPLELEQFKNEAIVRIQHDHQLHQAAASSSTSSTSTPIKEIDLNKAIFSHPALTTTEEDSEHSIVPVENLDELAKTQVKNILIVDSNDVFCKLYIKSFKCIFPQVSVTTAKSYSEALRRIEGATRSIFGSVSSQKATHGFDIILVEEQLINLNPRRNKDTLKMTGSHLLQKISLEQKYAMYASTFSFNGEYNVQHPRYSFLIGVSAHLDQDFWKLKKSGADLIWGKPPPSINQKLKHDLMNMVMKKRTNGV